MTEVRLVTPPATRGGSPHPRKPLGKARARTALLFTLPALTLLIVAVGWPLIQAVRISFSDWSGVGPIRWAGPSNFQEVLTDPEVWASVRITLLYSIVCALGVTWIAAVLAAAVSAGVKGSGFYRVVWFLPGIAPPAAVAIFWATAAQPGSGVANLVLGALGLGSDHAWLADPSTAIWPIALVTIWASVGFAFLLLLGAMEQVPVSVYEAARIDGASRARQFFGITMPLVRPVMVMLTLLEFIWAFNGFTFVWAMTQGGPGDATATLPVVVYKRAFQFSDFGQASAIAVLAGAFLIILGVIAQRLSRSAQ